MKFDNIDQAWSTLAYLALSGGERVGNTVELSNVHFTIKNAKENILKSRHNFSLHYYLGETIWYGIGANDVDFISKFGKIWKMLSDDGIVNNSAYGYILQMKHEFNQIEKMIELLKKDPNSRRAVMNINIPREDVIETKDEMCTIALQLLLRDGKLNMTGIMRSNDLQTGTPYDIFYFTTLQQYIAKELDVEVGAYDHFVSSMHIYDRDVENIEKSIKNYRDNKLVDVHVDGLKLLDEAQELYELLKDATPKEAKKLVIEICKQKEIIWGEDV